MKKRVEKSILAILLQIAGIIVAAVVVSMLLGDKEKEVTESIIHISPAVAAFYLIQIAADIRKIRESVQEANHSTENGYSREQ